MKFSFVNLKELNNKYDESLLTWRNQDHVRDMMITKNLITKEDHTDYLNKIYKSMDYDVYIGFKDKTPFSIVNIWGVSSEKKVYEYGYYLIHPKDLNGGLGILMEYFAIESVFKNDNNNTIKLNTLLYNKHAISLHKRFGYKGLIEDRGIFTQTLNYEDWINNKEKIEKIIYSFYNLKLEVFING